jgi:hypothetical protein
MARIKHLGIYRNITEEQVVLDCRILRILYRRGGMLKSHLVNALNLGPNNDPKPFEESLVRLEEWRCLEVKAPQAAHRRINCGCQRQSGSFLQAA